MDIFSGASRGFGRALAVELGDYLLVALFLIVQT